MHQPFHTSRLADTGWDLTTGIPVALIKRWKASGKTKELHDQLLAQYQVQGTLVCSDTCGFTRLSEQKPVAEVIYLVHQPKEVIYSYGKAIGGVPVGTWDADNTCMFYPQPIHILEIVQQMAAAQKQIQKDCTVEVGIGMLQGRYLRFNQKFMGSAYNLVTTITEQDLEPRELLVVHPGKDVLTLPENAVLKREGLPRKTPAVRIEYRALNNARPPSADKNYPRPFSDAFLEKIKSLDFTKTAALDRICAPYRVRTNICFIKLYVPGSALLLNNLEKIMIAGTEFKKIHQQYKVEVIDNTGDLYILLCNRTTVLLELLEQYGETLEQLHIRYSMGVAYGEVLKEHVPPKKPHVFGAAMNIASKLAEDCGELNCLVLHESVDTTGIYSWKKQPFEKFVSHVDLCGLKVSVPNVRMSDE